MPAKPGELATAGDARTCRDRTLSSDTLMRGHRPQPAQLEAVERWWSAQLIERTEPRWRESDATGS